MAKEVGSEKDDVKWRMEWHWIGYVLLVVLFCLLYRCFRVLFGFLLKLYRHSLACVNPKYRRRLALLKWIEKRAEQRINGFAELWENPAILGDVVNSVIPRAYDQDDGCQMSRYAALQQIQSLVSRYFDIRPMFLGEELKKPLDRKMENKFIRLLLVIKASIEKLEQTTNQEDASEYVARGMGLITATRGQPACFFIYSRHELDFDSIHIKITGPGGNTGETTITGTRNECNTSASGIQVSYEVVANAGSPQDGVNKCLRVVYLPKYTGEYRLDIMKHGYVILGSPFNITVEDSNRRIVSSEMSKPETRVINRVVDFGNEKMLLTDKGELIKINCDVHSSSALTKLKTQIDEQSAVAISLAKILQKDAARQTKPTPEVFFEICEYIMKTCQFILQNSSSSKGLRLVTGANKFISGDSMLLDDGVITEVAHTEQEMKKLLKTRALMTLSQHSMPRDDPSNDPDVVFIDNLLREENDDDVFCADGMKNSMSKRQELTENFLSPMIINRSQLNTPDIVYVNLLETEEHVNCRQDDVLVNSTQGLLGGFHYSEQSEAKAREFLLGNKETKNTAEIDIELKNFKTAEDTLPINGLSSTVETCRISNRETFFAKSMFVHAQTEDNATQERDVKITQSSKIILKKQKNVPEVESIRPTHHEPLHHESDDKTETGSEIREINKKIFSATAEDKGNYEPMRVHISVRKIINDFEEMLHAQNAQVDNIIKTILDQPVEEHRKTMQNGIIVHPSAEENGEYSCRERQGENSAQIPRSEELHSNVQPIGAENIGFENLGCDVNSFTPKKSYSSETNDEFHQNTACRVEENFQSELLQTIVAPFVNREQEENAGIVQEEILQIGKTLVEALMKHPIQTDVVRNVIKRISLDKSLSVESVQMFLSSLDESNTEILPTTETAFLEVPEEVSNSITGGLKQTRREVNESDAKKDTHNLSCQDDESSPEDTKVNDYPIMEKENTDSQLENASTSRIDEDQSQISIGQSEERPYSCNLETAHLKANFSGETGDIDKDLDTDCKNQIGFPTPVIDSSFKCENEPMGSTESSNVNKDSLQEERTEDKTFDANELQSTARIVHSLSNFMQTNDCEGEIVEAPTNSNDYHSPDNRFAALEDKMQQPPLSIAISNENNVEAVTVKLNESKKFIHAKLPVQERAEDNSSPVAVSHVQAETADKRGDLALFDMKDTFIGTDDPKATINHEEEVESGKTHQDNTSTKPCLMRKGDAIEEDSSVLLELDEIENNEDDENQSIADPRGSQAKCTLDTSDIDLNETLGDKKQKPLLCMTLSNENNIEAVTVKLNECKKSIHAKLPVQESVDATFFPVEVSGVQTETADKREDLALFVTKNALTGKDVPITTINHEEEVESGKIHQDDISTKPCLMQKGDAIDEDSSVLLKLDEVRNEEDICECVEEKQTIEDSPGSQAECGLDTSDIALRETSGDKKQKPLLSMSLSDESNVEVATIKLNENKKNIHAKLPFQESVAETFSPVEIVRVQAETAVKREDLTLFETKDTFTDKDVPIATINHEEKVEIEKIHQDDTSTKPCLMQKGDAIDEDLPVLLKLDEIKDEGDTSVFIEEKQTIEVSPALQAECGLDTSDIVRNETTLRCIENPDFVADSINLAEDTIGKSNDSHLEGHSYLDSSDKLVPSFSTMTEASDIDFESCKLPITDETTDQENVKIQDPGNATGSDSIACLEITRLQLSDVSSECKETVDPSVGDETSESSKTFKIEEAEVQLAEVSHSFVPNKGTLESSKIACLDLEREIALEHLKFTAETENKSFSSIAIGKSNCILGAPLPVDSETSRKWSDNTIITADSAPKELTGTKNISQCNDDQESVIENYVSEPEADVKELDERQEMVADICISVTQDFLSPNKNENKLLHLHHFSQRSVNCEAQAPSVIDRQHKDNESSVLPNFSNKDTAVSCLNDTKQFIEVYDSEVEPRNVKLDSTIYSDIQTNDCSYTFQADTEDVDVLIQDKSQLGDLTPNGNFNPPGKIRCKLCTNLPDSSFTFIDPHPSDSIAYSKIKGKLCSNQSTTHFLSESSASFKDLKPAVNKVEDESAQNRPLTVKNQSSVELNRISRLYQQNQDPISIVEQRKYKEEAGLDAGNFIPNEELLLTLGDAEKTSEEESFHDKETVQPAGDDAFFPGESDSNSKELSNEKITPNREIDDKESEFAQEIGVSSEANYTEGLPDGQSLHPNSGLSMTDEQSVIDTFQAVIVPVEFNMGFNDNEINFSENKPSVVPLHIDEIVTEQKLDTEETVKITGFMNCLNQTRGHLNLVPGLTHHSCIDEGNNASSAHQNLRETEILSTSPNEVRVQMNSTEGIQNEEVVAEVPDVNERDIEGQVPLDYPTSEKCSSKVTSLSKSHNFERKPYLHEHEEKNKIETKQAVIEYSDDIAEGSSAEFDLVQNVQSETHPECNEALLSSITSPQEMNYNNFNTVSSEYSFNSSTETQYSNTNRNDVSINEDKSKTVDINSLDDTGQKEGLPSADECLLPRNTPLICDAVQSEGIIISKPFNINFGSETVISIIEDIHPTITDRGNEEIVGTSPEPRLNNNKHELIESYDLAVIKIDDQQAGDKFNQLSFNMNSNMEPDQENTGGNVTFENSDTISWPTAKRIERKLESCVAILTEDETSMRKDELVFNENILSPMIEDGSQHQNSIGATKNKTDGYREPLALDDLLTASRDEILRQEHEVTPDSDVASGVVIINEVLETECSTTSVGNETIQQSPQESASEKDNDDHSSERPAVNDAPPSDMMRTELTVDDQTNKMLDFCSLGHELKIPQEVTTYSETGINNLGTNSNLEVSSIEREKDLLGTDLHQTISETSSSKGDDVVILHDQQEPYLPEAEGECIAQCQDDSPINNGWLGIKAEKFLDWSQRSEPVSESCSDSIQVSKELDFESIISAPNLDVALKKLEQKINSAQMVEHDDIFEDFKSETAVERYSAFDSEGLPNLNSEEFMTMGSNEPLFDWQTIKAMEPAEREIWGLSGKFSCDLFGDKSGLSVPAYSLKMTRPNSPSMDTITEVHEEQEEFLPYSPERDHRKYGANELPIITLTPEQSVDEVLQEPALTDDNKLSPLDDSRFREDLKILSVLDYMNVNMGNEPTCNIENAGDCFNEQKATVPDTSLTPIDSGKRIKDSNEYSSSNDLRVVDENQTCEFDTYSENTTNGFTRLGDSVESHEILSSSVVDMVSSNSNKDECGAVKDIRCNMNGKQINIEVKTALAVGDKMSDSIMPLLENQTGQAEAKSREDRETSDQPLVHCDSLKKSKQEFTASVESKSTFDTNNVTTGLRIKEIRRTFEPFENLVNLTERHNFLIKEIHNANMKGIENRINQSNDIEVTGRLSGDQLGQKSELENNEVGRTCDELNGEDSCSYELLRKESRITTTNNNVGKDEKEKINEHIAAHDRDTRISRSNLVAYWKIYWDNIVEENQIKRDPPSKSRRSRSYVKTGRTPGKLLEEDGSGEEDRRFEETQGLSEVDIIKLNIEERIRLFESMVAEIKLERNGLSTKSQDVTVIPSLDLSTDVSKTREGFIVNEKEKFNENIFSIKKESPQHSLERIDCQKNKCFQNQFIKLKEYFELLEQNTAAEKQESSSREPIARRIENTFSSSVLENKVGFQYKRRRRKRKSSRRQLEKGFIQSAPTSDSETAAQHTYQMWGSERLGPRVVERIHIKDLFEDVFNETDRTGLFRGGVPNRKAVLASLRSIDHVQDGTEESVPYNDDGGTNQELFVNLAESMSISNVPRGYQNVYPWIPTTPIHQYRSRPCAEHNLIPRNALLLAVDND